MSFQKLKNNYRNGDCIHKRSCRYILLGLLDEMKPRGVTSITLPSTNFDLENLILNRYKRTKLITSEINPEVYDAQVKAIRSEYQLHRYFMYQRDVFSLEGFQELNFVWLDLCGYLTEELYHKLQNFIQNNSLADEGIFAITLLSARENAYAKEFFRKLQQGKLGTRMTTLKNFRSIQFPKILKNDLEMTTNCRFTLASNYSYSPTSGAGLMTMYAFKWTRESNR